MACISPCQSGFSVSLLVSATTTDRSDFRRIAAPNTLLPPATPRRVSGTSTFSMTSSRREISWGVSIVGSGLVGQAGSGRLDHQVGFVEEELFEVVAVAAAVDD